MLKMRQLQAHEETPTFKSGCEPAPHFYHVHDMTLDDNIQTLDVEKELALGNAKEVDGGNLRCTQGLLPFVLTVLDGIGAPTPTAQQIDLAFLQYGTKGDGCVYIPEDVPAEQLPDNFPTLQRLRELPDYYFSKTVGTYNLELDDTVQFSLFRTEDGRVLVRCHYDLTQCRNTL